MTESGLDWEAVTEETIRFLTVRPDGAGWVGEAPAWFGGVLFGGFLVAQAVHAASRTAPEGRRIHSLHGYFLRPATAEVPLSYRVESVREGRSFSTRRVETTQNGTAVLTMACSFTTDTEGYEYELPLDLEVPSPEGLARTVGPGPWEEAGLGPAPAEPDGTRRSTHRAWVRTAARLPDDPHLHDAFIAFVTDMTGTGGRPLHLDGDVRGMVSLDHAAWFHRRLRADEWLYYDVHALINTGGRGLLRGTMYGPDRRLAVSVAQEMLLRPYDSVG